MELRKKGQLLRNTRMREETPRTDKREPVFKSIAQLAANIARLTNLTNASGKSALRMNLPMRFGVRSIPYDEKLGSISTHLQLRCTVQLRRLSKEIGRTMSLAEVPETRSTNGVLRISMRFGSLACGSQGNRVEFSPLIVCT